LRGRSAFGEGELLTAKDVEVEVLDALVGVGTRIEHKAVPALGDALFCSQGAGNMEEADKGKVGEGFNLIERGNMLVRDNEDVNRGNGMGIQKGGNQLILVND